MTSDTCEKCLPRSRTSRSCSCTRSPLGWRFLRMSCNARILASVAVCLPLWAGCLKDAKDSSKPVAVAASTGLAEKICSDCHEVEKLDRVHALLMVSAERMPPPQVAVDAATRSQLVRELCSAEYGNRDGDCIQR